MLPVFELRIIEHVFTGFYNPRTDRPHVVTTCPLTVQSRRWDPIKLIPTSNCSCSMHMPFTVLRRRRSATVGSLSDHVSLGDDDVLEDYFVLPVIGDDRQRVDRDTGTPGINKKQSCRTSAIGCQCRSTIQPLSSTKLSGQTPVSFPL
jgi:hypothetical protein